jgi:hypothetical protein
MDPVNVAQLLASAHTAELAVRTVGHGLHALGERLARLEREAASLRALSRVLAAQRARREPEPVAPVQRVAA